MQNVDRRVTLQTCTQTRPDAQDAPDAPDASRVLRFSAGQPWFTSSESTEADPRPPRSSWMSPARWRARGEACLYTPPRRGRRSGQEHPRRDQAGGRGGGDHARVGRVRLLRHRRLGSSGAPWRHGRVAPSSLSQVQLLDRQRHAHRADGSHRLRNRDRRHSGYRLGRVRPELAARSKPARAAGARPWATRGAATRSAAGASLRSSAPTTVAGRRRS